MSQQRMQQLKMPLLELQPTRNAAGLLNYEINAIHHEEFSDSYESFKDVLGFTCEHQNKAFWGVFGNKEH